MGMIVSSPTPSSPAYDGLIVQARQCTNAGTFSPLGTDARGTHRPLLWLRTLPEGLAYAFPLLCFVFIALQVKPTHSLLFFRQPVFLCPRRLMTSASNCCWRRQHSRTYYTCSLVTATGCGACGWIFASHPAADVPARLNRAGPGTLMGCGGVHRALRAPIGTTTLRCVSYIFVT
jgi:hypothetical protein